MASEGVMEGPIQCTSLGLMYFYFSWLFVSKSMARVNGDMMHCLSVWLPSTIFVFAKNSNYVLVCMLPKILFTLTKYSNALYSYYLCFTMLVISKLRQDNRWLFKLMMWQKLKLERSQNMSPELIFNMAHKNSKRSFGWGETVSVLDS